MNYRAVNLFIKLNPSRKIVNKKIYFISQHRLQPVCFDSVFIFVLSYISIKLQDLRVVISLSSMKKCPWTDKKKLMCKQIFCIISCRKRAVHTLKMKNKLNPRMSRKKILIQIDLFFLTYRVCPLKRNLKQNFLQTYIAKGTLF